MVGRPPPTPASVALSSVGSFSVGSQASSLSGSKLNALIERRSVLRAQMAIVENQLATMPPSTTPSVASRAPPSVAHCREGGSSSVAQMPAPMGPAMSLQGKLVIPSVPVQPISIKTDIRRIPTQVPRSMSSGFDETLPGAMRPGRYAFWPKRLPGAGSRRAAVNAHARSRASHSSNSPLTGVVPKLMPLPEQVAAPSFSSQFAPRY